MADPAEHVAARSAASRASPAWVVRAVIIAAYLLTPVFAFIDWKFELNLRVPSALDGGGTAIVYYIVVTALGVIMAWLPRGAALMAILESALNLALNAAGLMLWYVGILARAADATSEARGAPATGGDDAFNFPGFAISLAIVAVSYLAAKMRHILDESQESDTSR